MHCYLCQVEAVGRCFTCGQLFCAAHGQRDCIRCTTAIAPGDRRSDHVSAVPLGKSPKVAWWRPQLAEDFEPPACYACRGLARTVCRNCQGLYCAEHAGKGGLCAACDRSSWWGMWLLGGLLLSLAVLAFLVHTLERWR